MRDPKARTSDKRGARRQRRIVIDLNAVVVAVTRGLPHVLTVERSDHLRSSLGQEMVSGRSTTVREALPFGPFDPGEHRTLEFGLRGWVQEQTRLSLGYVEQLYTFGDRYRDFTEKAGGPRIVSVGYLALVRETEGNGAGDGRWQNWYRYFPWEDRRRGRPAIVDGVVSPRLMGWARRSRRVAERRRREERVVIAFGLGEAAWDGERVLERYELLYEAGLVAEAVRDAEIGAAGADPAPPVDEQTFGVPMALDHRRILATAMGRLRGKISYRPVVFELLPASFTLLQLQRVVEALAGIELHKQNFRRLVEKGGLVERTGDREVATGGRPAERYRFRRDVVLERPAPGVGLPELRSDT